MDQIVIPSRLEREPHALKVHCSNQLSYETIQIIIQRTLFSVLFYKYINNIFNPKIFFKFELLNLFGLCLQIYKQYFKSKNIFKKLSSSTFLFGWGALKSSYIRISLSHPSKSGILCWLSLTFCTCWQYNTIIKDWYRYHSLTRCYMCIVKHLRLINL